jgi:hypothetical protein
MPWLFILVSDHCHRFLLRLNCPWLLDFFLPNRNRLQILLGLFQWKFLKTAFTWIASVNVLNLGLTRFHLDYSGGFPTNSAWRHALAVHLGGWSLPSIPTKIKLSMTSRLFPTQPKSASNITWTVPVKVSQDSIHLDCFGECLESRSNSFPAGLFWRIPHQFCLEACLGRSSWWVITAIDSY